MEPLRAEFKFVGTDSLSPAANHFDLHGKYTLYPRGTQGYLDFWREEARRCDEGYEANGIKVTGFHYFYLNYCRMQRVIDRTLPNGEQISERFESFPLFYDEDHYYFHKIDEARRTNKHMVVLKARRKGFSYKAASMLCRNYFLKKKSKNFVYAGLKEHLEGEDAILTKTWAIMNFIDVHTAWTQPRLKNHPSAKVSGYREKVKGSYVDLGTLNSITGLSLKDDPDKVRGKGADLAFFEEAGDFKELLDAWNRAMPSFKQGNKTLGMMVAFGTGGTEGDGFESLNELFYNPGSYDILEFDNIWSEAGMGTKCGYFCPIYKMLEGFIDEHGNSEVEKAKEFELVEREKKRKGANPKSYDSYLAENPWTPEEATLQVSGNLFNIAMLKEQRDRVMVNNLHTTMGTPGRLYRGQEGVKFKVDFDLKPIHQFPHKKTDDLNGAVTIYEPPYKMRGITPKFMYFICHDPYGQDKSQTRSLGAAYVIKRVNQYSQPDDIIVASYVGRPESQDTYNENLFMLAEYYNAPIGFENDRGEIIPFAKRKRKLMWLQKEFEMLHAKELQSKTVNRGYGMHMTIQRKLQAELYSRDWLETSRGKGEDDSPTLNVHKIYDLALLDELIKFNHEGNFDRVMALFVGMFHMKEMYHSEVQDSNDLRVNDEFFDRLYMGKINTAPRSEVFDARDGEYESI
jgi:hypothetical protein